MRYIVLAFFLLVGTHAVPQSIIPRDGWVIIPTSKSFEVLLMDLKQAVDSQGFAVVTQAGPTGAARSRGITIPNNRVVGVFNNIFAVRILEASVPAMIEAPIRFYLTEDESGSATLSYKRPSFVFQPYTLDGAPDLVVAAAELDAAFDAMAMAAVR